MRTLLAKDEPRTIPILFLLWAVSFYIFGERAETVFYSDLMLYGLVAAVGLHVLRGAPFTLGSPVLLTSIFVTYSVTSYFWSWRPEATGAKAVTMLLLLALFTVLWVYFGGRDPEYVIWVLCVAGIVLSGYVVLHYGPAAYVAGLLAGERMGRDINNLNALAMQTGLSAVICFWFALHRDQRAFYGWSVLPILVTFGTGSRKGLVLILGGVLLLYALALSPGRRTRVIAGIGVFLLAISLVIELPIFATLTERLSGVLGEAQPDYSTAVRQEMIAVGLDQFSRTPLLGIGMGASGLLTAARFNDDTYLHNNFVELLATLGSIGLLLYYALYAHILIRLAPRVRARDATAIIVAVILLLQLPMDYGAVSYDSKTTWTLLLVGFLAVHAPPPPQDVAEISSELPESLGLSR